MFRENLVSIVVVDAPTPCITRPSVAIVLIIYVLSSTRDCFKYQGQCIAEKWYQMDISIFNKKSARKRLIMKDLISQALWSHILHLWEMNHASFTWWRHQMETFSALLAICAGNSPVSGEFPAQRPVTRSFDVFFDVRLIKRLSKHSRGWWFETPSHPLWRHRNEKKRGPPVYAPV